MLARHLVLPFLLRVPLWLTLLALVSGGCVDLSAVRRFADLSASVASYPQLVADYVESPARAQRYQPDAQRGQLDLKARLAQREPLERVQNLLVEYMLALGALADNDVASIDEGTSGLRKALESAKLVGDGTHQLSADHADAAQKLVTLLSSAILNGWRRRQLDKLIAHAEPHLQKVIAGLTQILERQVSKSLTLEQDEVESAFDTWLKETSDDEHEGEHSVIVALRAQRVDEVQAKQTALTQYVAALRTIARGHTALYANTQKTDKKRLVSQLKQHARALLGLYGTIKKLIP
jgi:hypothetical protein